MAERRFEVDLPAEVLAGFGWGEGETPRRVREALVMALVRLDRLSEAEAASLLGLDRWELLETMGRYGVPAVRMSGDDLKRELATRPRLGDRA